ncbi:hypothetical protein JOD24_000910 [Kroppenstedtia sanguinis]|uniref:Uncharacterized protein n=1 Tax=Kroppenstedtia sanguinis TaxID=1380684 RepID=A0ABW4C726_9BACL
MKRRKEEFIPEDVENEEEPAIKQGLIGLGIWCLIVIAYVAMVRLGWINGL